MQVEFLRKRRNKAPCGVRKRIRRNLIRKQKILSQEMKISSKTMSAILRDDLQPIRKDLSKEKGAPNLG